MWRKDNLNVYIHQLPITPLVPVRLDLAAPPVWCTLEFLNPSGSTKDRIALHILEKALRLGILPVGPSSGLNFLAALEAARGLEAEAVVVTVFPDRMERYFSTRLFRGDASGRPAVRPLPPLPPPAHGR